MNIAKRMLIMTGRDRARPSKGGSMNIAGSIVIITGASSGIGAATARELARRGATVVLAARRAEELNRMATDITHLGHKALAVPTDVGSRQSIDHLVAHTVEAYGRIDGVVNVAGIGGAGIIEQASDDVLEAMVMINLLAPARLIQAALPFMQHDGCAAIVNIGYIAGEMGTDEVWAAGAQRLPTARTVDQAHCCLADRTRLHPHRPDDPDERLTARTRTRCPGCGQGLGTSPARVSRPFLLAPHAAWCSFLSSHRRQTIRKRAGTGTNPYLGMKGREYAHTQ